MNVYLLKLDADGKTYFWEKHSPCRVFVGESGCGMNLGFDEEYTGGFTVVPYEKDTPPRVMSTDALAAGHKEPEIRDAK